MGNCCKEERSDEYTKAIQTIFRIRRSDFNNVNIFSSESSVTYGMYLRKSNLEKFYIEDLCYQPKDFIVEFESLLIVTFSSGDETPRYIPRSCITVSFKMTEENIKRWLLDTNFRLLPSCVRRCPLYDEILLRDSMVKWFREHNYVVYTKTEGLPFKPIEVIAFNKT